MDEATAPNAQFRQAHNGGDLKLVENSGFCQLRVTRNFAITRSIIGSQTLCGNSNELLSVTIFIVLQLES